MKFLHSEKAPAAIGPYSQAVASDRWLFTSGQIALDPDTGEMVAGDFSAQVARVLENLRQVLAAADCDFSSVVKATVYLTDMGNFPVFNELYAQVLGDHRPARSTIEVSALPKGALVEVDLVARLG